MRPHTPSPRFKEFAFIIVLCVVWFLIGWLARGWALPSDAMLVDEARQVLNNTYPPSVPTDRELTYAAIEGMLDRIDDPYAQVLDPAVGRAYLADFAGASGVVGMSPVRRDGHIVASQVLSGQAADRAGLRSGDVILSVDGVIFDKDMTEAQAAHAASSRSCRHYHTSCRSTWAAIFSNSTSCASPNH